MLLCVTGGKLSEGINFPDGYARLINCEYVDNSIE